MLTTSNALGFPLLTLVIFLPLVGAAVVALQRDEAGARVQALGVFFAGTTLIGALILFQSFQPLAPGFQFVDDLAGGPGSEWLPGGFSYVVGLDGLSVVLFLLAALLQLVALLFSWGSVTTRVREYVILMLVLETGVLGVFAALDLFLFYVFWELTLIPMVLLIGVWGGAGRVYASLKFALYTLAGSALMLVAIVAVGHQAAGDSYRILDLLAAPTLGITAQLLLFGAFFMAFAVKVPLFPLHTWLPDAHVEAPTAGSIILAGILLKMGGYGFVRIAMPLFPDATHQLAPWIIALALIAVWYGAWVAFAQDDVKSLVAYTSVSHMGLVVVGLFALNAIGLAGGTLQMVNHGLATGALFLLVGVLYDRAHSRRIADFGGLWRQMPRWSALFLLVTLASIGLPGLNGFVGEWLALAGAFRAQPLYGALAAVGMVLGAATMLWMIQRVLFGPQDGAHSRDVADISTRELVALAPLVVLIVWLGVYPATFLTPINTASVHWITLIARGAIVAAGGP